MTQLGTVENPLTDYDFPYWKETLEMIEKAE